MEFSQEELLDVIDAAVQKLLGRVGATDPPVDALELLRECFGFTVTVEHDEDDPDGMESATARYVRIRGGGGGAPKRKPRPRELIIRDSMSLESRNVAAARAAAKELLPGLLKELGAPASVMEQKSSVTQLVGTVAPRILLPKRWYEREARRASGDVAKLKAIFTTATWEMIALKLLEQDDICVIAVVDDGNVALRRSNGIQVTKKLTEAEEECAATAAEDVPVSARRDGWRARGWLVPTGPYRRVIVRSQPEDV